MRPVATMHGVFRLSILGLNSSLLVESNLSLAMFKIDMFIRKLLISTALLSALLLSSLASAQHSHGILTPGVTFPPDDSVLREPPQMITMSFRVDVVLLKLALYTAEGDWINIGFQFDPNRMDNAFVYQLPEELPPSEFYTARWSVSDNTRRLVNGEFNFSFGPGALPPSEIIASRVSDLEENLPDTGSYREIPDSVKR